MPFTFTKTEIENVILIEPRVFNDSRGCFMETYKASDFKAACISEDFVQDNHSVSSKDVLRGLHFQTNPAAQGKLVRVIKGAVWDVAVDLRESSPTFKKWVAYELSEDNFKMLYIPPGFGHGFISLKNNTVLNYKCTAEYSPEHDGGIIWNDPDISIKWPVENPLLSSKDEELPFLKDAILF